MAQVSTSSVAQTGLNKHMFQGQQGYGSYLYRQGEIMWLQTCRAAHHTPLTVSTVPIAVTPSPQYPKGMRPFRILMSRIRGCHLSLLKHLSLLMHLSLTG